MRHVYAFFDEFPEWTLQSVVDKLSCYQWGERQHGECVAEGALVLAVQHSFLTKFWLPPNTGWSVREEQYIRRRMR